MGDGVWGFLAVWVPSVGLYRRGSGGGMLERVECLS